MLNLPKRSIYTKHRPLFILAGIVSGIGFLGFIAILVVLALGPFYIRVVEHPRFCGSLCHEMKPSYRSYIKSSHNGIRCSECHSEPGVKGFVKGLAVDAAREVYIHMSGEEFYNMDELHPKLSDLSCMRDGCHKVENLIAKNTLFADDRIFNHRMHGIEILDQAYNSDPASTKTLGALPALNCISCHSQNKEKHMDVDQHVCFLCHFGSGGKKVNLGNCNLCHVIPAPQHKKIDSISSCRECHSMIIADVAVPVENCIDCHKDEIKSQSAELVHKTHVKPQNARCMECHQLLQQSHGQLIAHYSKNCQSCHSQSKEMHALADQRVCFLCHSMSKDRTTGMKNCSDCHVKTIPKHGTAMRDDNSCNKCHAIVAADTLVLEEKCAKCHKDEVEQLDSETVHKKHAQLEGSRCLECHLALKQKHGQLFAHYSSECQKCHSNQTMMYRGTVNFVAQIIPSPKAQDISCSACHSSVIKRGTASRDVIRQECLVCHEEGYDQILDDWQEMIGVEIKKATELLIDVDKLIRESMDTKQNQQASSLYNKAKEQIIFVQNDNSLGAHNVELTDQLLTDAMDKLKKCQQLIK